MNPAPALLQKLWIANITNTIKEGKKKFYIYTMQEKLVCVCLLLDLPLIT